MSDSLASEIVIGSSSGLRRNYSSVLDPEKRLQFQLTKCL